MLNGNLSQYKKLKENLQINLFLFAHDIDIRLNFIWYLLIKKI